jgi:hypothetical protein
MCILSVRCCEVAPERLTSLSGLRPSAIYRGVLVNAASIGPISAFQYATNGALTLLHRNCTAPSPDEASADGPRRATAAESLGIAAATGAVSSLVVAPAELVMIAQQTSGLGLAATLGSLARHGGARAFWRGLSATCVREAGWVVGFLGLAPTIKAALREDSKFFNYNPGTTSFAIFFCFRFTPHVAKRRTDCTCMASVAVSPRVTP